MTIRRVVTVGAIVMALCVGRWSVGWTQEAATRPLILSGDDIGFQVTEVMNGVPSGFLVVRLNGKWVPISNAPRVFPVK